MTQQDKNNALLTLSEQSKAFEMIISFLFQAKMSNWTYEEVMSVLKEIQEAQDQAVQDVLSKYLVQTKGKQKSEKSESESNN